MSKKTTPESNKPAKKASPKTKAANESTIEKKRKSKTAKLPWLILIVSVALSLGTLSTWLEFSYFKARNAEALASHKTITAAYLQNIINKQLTITQEKLSYLGSNTQLVNAANTSNQEALDNIAAMLASAFYKTYSLKIIPWDLSGTAGLQEKGITPRNNTELMLLSQAGSNKPTKAEAYKIGNEWLISYAAPIISNDKVVAVILLTFDKSYLTRLVSNEALNHTVKLNFMIKGNDPQTITSSGEGDEHNVQSYDLAYTDGQVNIAFNESELTQFSPTQSPIYIGLAIILFILLIAIFIANRIISAFIKQDTTAIQNYATAQKSLHQTKAPTLNLHELDAICDAISVLGNMNGKTSLNPEANNDYKKSDGKPSSVQAVAAAIVSERIPFDHPDIFKAYDIRGLAEKQLTTDICILLGKAIGSKAVKQGIQTLVSARDGRLSSERIQNDITNGILSTGCNVIDIGLQPTPVLYYATQKLETGAGIMITGSHNPAEYNGVKIVLDHKTLLGDDIQDFLTLVESQEFIEGQGQASQQDVTNEYIQDVSADIIIAKPLNIVIDAGNGVGGAISSQLLNMLDCHVTELYCDVDGNFPNHGPDPMIASNLSDLINKVTSTGADLGIAFDGDADRMIAVTANGKIVSSDEILMLFAKDVVSSNAGCSVIYDVKSSRNIQKIVSDFGGRPIMSKSGHSNLKAMIQESGALLGGEFTGHFYFNERWNGFDDGIYAAMRLIELLSTSNQNFDEELANLPNSFNTGEFHIPVKDTQQAATILKKINDILRKEQCKIIDIDGLRTEFANGWGLIRPSNTSNTMTLRFEADNEEALAQIQNTYRKAINQLNLNLSIPF